MLRQTRVGDAVTRRELRLSTPVERRLQVNAVRLALGGDEVGVVMVMHDVTELRRLEQVRTEFIANVSHEVRTPLTAILGYLETLLAGALEEPEHARKFLEIVFRHTERLGRLLSDLTDLSNIELGKVSLRLQPTSLPETVESVLTIIGPKADTGEVALTSDVPRDLPLVRADHDRLAQILINLVDNAVKYTPRGGRVTVRARPDGPDMVVVTVVDTGVGIPRARSAEGHRALLSSGQGPFARAGGHRPRPGHRQAPGPRPRRGVDDRERVRPGHRGLVRPAGGA